MSRIQELFMIHLITIESRMPTVKIYGVPLSAPTRIVMMTCEVLGVKYELIETNPLTGGTRTEKFLKVPPSSPQQIHLTYR